MVKNELFNITIVGQKDCPFCDKAKEYAKHNGLTFTYIDIDGPAGTALRQLLKSMSWNTVPAIWYGTSFIGGYNQLREQWWEYDI